MKKSRDPILLIDKLRVALKPGVCTGQDISRWVGKSTHAEKSIYLDDMCFNCLVEWVNNWESGRFKANDNIINNNKCVLCKRTRDFKSGLDQIIFISHYTHPTRGFSQTPAHVGCFKKLLLDKRVQTHSILNGYPVC